jgi:hypothetical protein
LDGATCWRVVAKLCRANEEGENCAVECASADDLTTGTTVQAVSSGDDVGAHGAMATWRTSSAASTRVASVGSADEGA